MTQRQNEPATGFALDTPLIQLSPQESWSIRDAVQGTQVFGGTGSGKTSGSGQAIAKAFLRSGFGGLVLTAKSDERALWEQYAAETGRTDSLLLVQAGGNYRFNFLDYELRRPGSGAGFTENLVELFVQVMEVGERKPGGSNNGGSGGDAYWMRAMRQLLRNAIELSRAATGLVSLPILHDIVVSAPRAEDVSNKGWQDSSVCFECINRAESAELPKQQREDVGLSISYWLNDFANLAEKTRSIIVSVFSGLSDVFLRSPLRELFGSYTSFVPEHSHQGAVIVLDLPLKEYSQLGQYAQVLFKLMWQRATERRDITTSPRPVFLWVDESQYFLTSEDMLFQTTARSAKACTVYLSQNLPNYYAALGRQNGKDVADSLLGNLQTKVFHSNSDHVTNKWAADLIARSWKYRASSSVNRTARSVGSGAAEGERQSQGVNSSTSKHLEHQVLPIEFTTLRTGGPPNGLCVDAIIFQGGRVWQPTGKNHLRTVFRQDQ